MAFNILNFIKAAHLGYLNEYPRPWKLVTLILGTTLLILGSFYYTAPDWDIPISIIMAIFTYIFAPWSIRVLLERRWRLLPLVFFFTWFSVDGCYAIYWHFKNPVALEQMREANLPRIFDPLFNLRFYLVVSWKPQTIFHRNSGYFFT